MNIHLGSQTLGVSCMCRYGWLPTHAKIQLVLALSQLALMHIITICVCVCFGMLRVRCVGRRHSRWPCVRAHVVSIVLFIFGDDDDGKPSVGSAHQRQRRKSLKD